MRITRRDYADGTFIDTAHPWGEYVRGRAMCSDGKVRTLKRISPTADTFFSVPASVVVKGRTIAGYVTISTRDGFSTETEHDPARVEFHAYRYGKNGALLPDEFDRGEVNR